MEKRITWIDTVRGGAMICVVLGHLGVGFINDIVYAFHMPVFFMLTGYMVRINQKELDCKVVQKKFLSLMRPYFITCFYILSMDIINSIIIWKNASIEEITKIVSDDLIRSFFASGSISQFGNISLSGRIGAIWFLPAMFFASIVAQYLLTRLYSWKKQFSIAILLFILAVVIRDFIWFPFSVQAAGSSVVFILLGYYLLERGFSNKKYLIISSLILVFGIIAKYSRIYMVESSFQDLFFSPVVAVAGVIVFIHIMKKMDRISYLNFIGRYSLVFLCVHLFEMETMWYWFEQIIIVRWLNVGEDYRILALFIIKLIFISSITFIIVKINQWMKNRKAPVAYSISSKRDLTIDGARTVAIIVMIVGYFSVNFSFGKILYSVCISIFLFFSGFFYKKQNLCIGIRKHAKMLLIPYCISACMCIIIQYFQGNITANEISFECLRYLAGMSFSNKILTDIGSVGPIYFFLLLFLIRSIYLFVDIYIQRDEYKTITIVGISLLGYYLGKMGLWLPWGIDMACYGIIFYHIGRIFREKHLLEHLKQNCWSYFILSTVWAYMIYCGSVDLSMRNYGMFTLGILGSISGICLVYLLCSYLLQSLILAGIYQKMVSVIGKNTIYVLIVHTVLNELLNQFFELYFDRNYIYLLILTLFIQICIGVIIGTIKDFGKKLLFVTIK